MPLDCGAAPCAGGAVGEGAVVGGNAAPRASAGTLARGEGEEAGARAALGSGANTGGAFASVGGRDKGGGFIAGVGGALASGLARGGNAALGTGAGVAAGGGFDGEVAACGAGTPWEAGPWVVGVGVASGLSWKSLSEGGAAASAGTARHPAAQASKHALLIPGFGAAFMVPVAMPDPSNWL